MREEKRWLHHENVFSHFSLLAAKAVIVINTITGHINAK